MIYFEACCQARKYMDFLNDLPLCNFKPEQLALTLEISLNLLQICGG